VAVVDKRLPTDALTMLAVVANRLDAFAVVAVKLCTDWLLQTMLEMIAVVVDKLEIVAEDEINDDAVRLWITPAETLKSPP
jgi:hypothetical protein